MSNDPANLTDPSGKLPFLIPIAAGFAFAGWANIASQEYSNRGTGKHWFWDLDGGEMSIADSVGGATSAIAPGLILGKPLGTVIARSALLGSAANTTQYWLVQNQYYGKKMTCEGVIWSIETGAVGGGIAGLGLLKPPPSTRFMDYWPSIPLADDPGGNIFRAMGRMATANRNAAIANSTMGGNNVYINPLSNFAYNYPQQEQKK